MVTNASRDGVRILPILRDVVSGDPSDRARGADAATDLIWEYSDEEVVSLAFTLACAFEVEVDRQAQEAQLHALAEFAEYGVLPGFVLRRVLGMDMGELAGSAREHLEYLLEMADVE
jgi:hypothetical protein